MTLPVLQKREGGMIMGVVSDTHGNREGMLLLAERLKSMGIQTLLHLGDDYRDIGTLAQTGLEVLGVPGLYCPEYLDPTIPNRQIVELGGLKFLLSHTETRSSYDDPEDLDPEMACYAVDAVLFGHSHTPVVSERQGVIWINPGHLRDRTDRGSPPSFALLHISPTELKVQVYLLADGRSYLDKTFPIKFQE
ncbi:MAG: metallophosphoesterase family protein [Desulfobaccales bacterium]